MVFFFNKKHFKFGFLAVAIGLVVLLSISYFLSIKIHDSFFRSINLKNTGFIKSYESFNISYNSKQVKIYNLKNNASPVHIVYVPSKYGALNDIVTAISAKYNFYGFEYPVDKHHQNFSALLGITKAAIQNIINSGVKPENIILFGHGIGANVVFESSIGQNFMAVIMLNSLNDEKSYCKKTFFPVFCLTVRSTFSFAKYNKNLIYFFFNKGEFFSTDDNYDIFNLIKSRDKFLFEIPGEDINFNFNHIIDFYNNEGKTQLEIYETKSLMEDSSSVIDVDGYTDPDAYFD